MKVLRVRDDSHGVGHDQQVHVVEQGDLGHLHDEHVEHLDEEHEEELPYAAHLQEHGAGQQTEQHTGREVLQRERERERGEES